MKTKLSGAPVKGVESAYMPPRVEALEVGIEQGFALSGEAALSGFGEAIDME